MGAPLILGLCSCWRLGVVADGWEMAGAGAGVGTVLRWGMVLVLTDGWDGTGIEVAGIES